MTHTNQTQRNPATDPHDDGHDIELQSKRDCALALCSLVGNTDLQDQVLEEGMIDAFVALSSTPDQVIRTACSRALCRLTCNAANWSQMIQDNAIPALISLSVGGAGWRSTSPTNGGGSGGNGRDTTMDVATQLACIGVANLACMEGSEMLFINSNAQHELIRHCQTPMVTGTGTSSGGEGTPDQRVLLSTARLLFNLCHVDIIYQGLENVAQTVVRLTKMVVNKSKAARTGGGVKSGSGGRRRAVKNGQESDKEAWYMDVARHHNDYANGGGAPVMLELTISCTNLADLDELSGR